MDCLLKCHLRILHVVIGSHQRQCETMCNTISMFNRLLKLKKEEVRTWQKNLRISSLKCWLRRGQCVDGICRDLNVIWRISWGRHEQTNQMFKWCVSFYADIGAGGGNFYSPIKLSNQYWDACAPLLLHSSLRASTPARAKILQIEALLTLSGPAL
jgi:hypothetical protein